MKEINKFAILVIFKDGSEKKLFSSLKVFVEKYPQYSIDTIYNYTSRKKKPFEDDKIILEKVAFV
jgi:hypothetical protein